MNYFNFFINFIAIFALSWYLILNLQWYNYKLQRVVLNHHKKVWHLFYFIFPLLLWIVLKEIYFAPILILYLIALYFWAKKIEDRKSTRLNSSHVKLSYAVFCLKNKN